MVVFYWEQGGGLLVFPDESDFFMFLLVGQFDFEFCIFLIVKKWLFIGKAVCTMDSGILVALLWKQVHFPK